jgi:hypothetical protein
MPALSDSSGTEEVSVGFFKKVGRWAKKATKKVVAPVVHTVSPKAARRIRSAADRFEQFGAEADRRANRFTADVAKEAASIAKDAQRFGEEAGHEIAKGFSKNGFVTNFAQDYVPGGGFVTAIFHAAAGNEDYAQYAAVKGVSSTIVTAGAVVGTLAGGPGGAIAAGALAGAAASAWEGGMRTTLQPSVKGKLDPLSVEGVLVAGAIGGVAGGLGYGASKAAGLAKEAAKGAAKKAAGLSVVKRLGGLLSRAPKVRPRSNAILQAGTRPRSFSSVLKPPTRLQQLRFRGLAGLGVFRRSAAGGAKGFGKRVGIAAGGGVLREVAGATGATDALEGVTRRIGRGTKILAGIVGAGLLGFGATLGLGLWGRDSSPPPTTVAAAITTTTVAPTTTAAPAATAATQPPTTTTTTAGTTTLSPPMLSVMFTVEVGNATEEDFTLLVDGEPVAWGGPGQVAEGSHTIDVQTGFQSYRSGLECDGAAVGFGEPLAFGAGEARSCIITTRFVPAATTTTTQAPAPTTTAPPPTTPTTCDPCG